MLESRDMEEEEEDMQCPLSVGSHYAQVKRRSVSFLDQTMLRGEAFGPKM